MKSPIFAGVSAILLFCTCAQAKQPVFTFMGDSTATQSRRTTLDGMPCERKGRALECGPTGEISWHGERFNFVSLTYWDGRLIRVVGAFDRKQHARVRSLLERTYGKPQDEGYQTMAERPDPFTYPETVWKFDDGRLELDSQTDDDEILLFRFSVTHPPDDWP